MVEAIRLTGLICYDKLIPVDEHPLYEVRGRALVKMKILHKGKKTTRVGWHWVVYDHGNILDPGEDEPNVPYQNDEILDSYVIVQRPRQFLPRGNSK